MDIQHVRALYDAQVRRDLEYPGGRREVLPKLVRHFFTDTHDGLVSYSRLTAEDADLTIQAQIDYYQGLGADFEWKYHSHDSPPDLLARIKAHGFELDEEEEAILVLDVNEAPETLLQPVKHDVRRVTAPDELATVVSVQAAVWGEDRSALADHLTFELRSTPDLLSVYTASVDGTLATSAWTRFYPNTQFGSLWGGATLPAYRQHGLYTALLAVRVQEARERGVRYLTVDASSMSRPILEKRGFRLICMSVPCKWRKR
jgi:GNAT superfamily N-acetyltransferase